MSLQIRDSFICVCDREIFTDQKKSIFLHIKMCKEIPDEEKNDLRKEMNKCCSRNGTMREIKMKKSKIISSMKSNSLSDNRVKTEVSVVLREGCEEIIDEILK